MYGNCGPACPTLAAKMLSIGAFEENDAECLGSLCVMYELGYQMNPSEPVRAAKFYSQEAGSYTMNN